MPGDMARYRRYRELVPLEDARGGAAVLAAALGLGVQLHLIQVARVVLLLLELLDVPG